MTTQSLVKAREAAEKWVKEVSEAYLTRNGLTQTAIDDGTVERLKTDLHLSMQVVFEEGQKSARKPEGGAWPELEEKAIAEFLTEKGWPHSNQFFELARWYHSRLRSLLAVPGREAGKATQDQVLALKVIRIIHVREVLPSPDSIEIPREVLERVGAAASLLRSNALALKCAHESVIRADHGNTNIECVEYSVKQVDEALALLRTVKQGRG